MLGNVIVKMAIATCASQTAMMLANGSYRARYLKIAIFSRREPMENRN